MLLISYLNYFDLENIYDFSLLENLKDFNDFWQILNDKGVDQGKRVSKDSLSL